MELSIGSYSFHRLLASGKQDMFQYIKDCKDLGCTQLDPWNAHLAGVQDAETVKHAGNDPAHAQLPAQDDEYISRVKAAADAADLPFGCVAVDGAHIYEPTLEGREANRRLAYRWLDIAEKLGARQLRIDAGGPPEMPDEVFALIVEGYGDLVFHGQAKGVEIVIENHWGPSPIPENLVKILDAVPGLGLLFDTNNWAEGMQQKGWEMCASYATATHVKTFSFDAAGNDPSVDAARAINLLLAAGYHGCWGVESCPVDGDEYAGARKTIALIRRVLGT